MWTSARQHVRMSVTHRNVNRRLRIRHAAMVLLESGENGLEVALVKKQGAHESGAYSPAAEGVVGERNRRCGEAATQHANEAF